MSLYFILVEPAIPENIGASARAIKTMGFNKLRLVNPCNFKTVKAKQLAHGSFEILEHAEVFSNFDDAIEDIDLIIGTTSKLRRTNADNYDPEEVVEIIKKKDGLRHNIAIVFGSEEHGLTNIYLRKCDIISTIPLANRYPSLNLSQAVMIYAFILSSLKDIEKSSPAKDLPHLKVIKKNAETIFNSIEIATGSTLYNRLMERISAAGNDDLNLISSVINKLLEKYSK